MAAEAALAVVVLIAAALFVPQARQSSQEIDPGFRSQGLLAAYDLRPRPRR